MLTWNDEVIREDGVPNSKDVAQKDLVDGQFYYIAYDDIVWVELITNEQDTIINYFSSISKFEMVVTKNGIKVYGGKLKPLKSGHR